MKTIKRLFHYMEGCRGYAAASLLFALLSVICKVAIPFIAGLAIDRLWANNNDISLYLILIAVFVVLGMVFRYLYDMFTAYVGQKLVKNMRDEVYASFNRVSLRYIDNHTNGDLVLRLVNDIENVQTGLIAGAGALYEGIVQIAITLVFMFMLNWILALTVIVLTPISVIVSKFVSSRNSRYYKQQNVQTGFLTAFSLESIVNLETTKAYGLEKNKEKNFDNLNSSLKTSNFKATFAVGWINPSTRLVNNIVYAVVTFLGAYLVITKPGLGIEAFGVGSLSALLSYAYQYMSPFNEIADVASEVSYAFASFKRIDETVQTHDDVDAGVLPLNDEIATLEAKHINFSYDSGRPIIKDFNINVYKGHKIALVGPTGCGKTTIINLLLRFYDPNDGAFVVNEKSTTEYPKEELRKHIGMVLQDTWLFRGTIRDNIAYGKEGASFDEIVEAAKKSHADDFIRQLPDGYDTVVSNSSGLSTGQKQLLCVARIMLAEPEVVILDEATSNIDLRTELTLAKGFDELMKGKTSIVVAHRLSTIKNADLILVLKSGSIVEQGNFSELMAKNGFFRNLYDSQLS